MQKLLIVLGILFIIIGIAWPLIMRLGIGHLPGDIIIKRSNFTFYFPLMTCIIVSIILTLIFWLFHK